VDKHTTHILYAPYSTDTNISLYPPYHETFSNINNKKLSTILALRHTLFLSSRNSKIKIISNKVQPDIKIPSYSNKRIKINFSQQLNDILNIKHDKNIEWEWVEDASILIPYNFNVQKTS
jgi:hypothetical protein